MNDRSSNVSVEIVLPDQANVWLTRIPHLVEENPNLISCLDMASLRPDRTLSLIKQAHQACRESKRGLVPCILVLADFPEVVEHGQAMVNSGAFLYEKPEGFSIYNEDDTDKLKRKIEEEYPHIEGFRESASEEVPPSGSEGGADLRIYANPPFQISDEDFRQLIDRMRTPDDSWMKDD